MIKQKEIFIDSVHLKTLLWIQYFSAVWIFIKYSQHIVAIMETQTIFSFTTKEESPRGDVSYNSRQNVTNNKIII